MENNESSAPSEAVSAETQEHEVATTVEASPETITPAKVEAIKKEVVRLNKIKLRLDGEDIEEELPFSIEDNPEAVEYLKKNLQLSKSAQRRMQVKSDYEKKVDQFLDLIQDNPELILQRFGKDPEAWAVDFLKKKIAESEMTPEQRELAAARIELEAIKKKQQADEETRKDTEMTLMRDKAEQGYEQTIMQALSKSGVPQTPAMVHKMAQHMYLAADRESILGVDELAEMVKQDYIKEMRDYLKASPDETIEELVGQDRIKGFRKKQVQALKQASESVPSKVTATGDGMKPKQSEKKEKNLKISDFLRGV